jgi:hypothetical protein
MISQVPKEPLSELHFADKLRARRNSIIQRVTQRTGMTHFRSAAMTSATGSNQPLSEQYRLLGLQWVEADKAAHLMEESKSSVYSQMCNKKLIDTLGNKVPMNRIESEVKASEEYREYVATMVDLRSRANLLKIELEAIRMRHAEEQSYQATARAERRL